MDPNTQKATDDPENRSGADLEAAVPINFGFRDDRRLPGATALVGMNAFGRVVMSRVVPRRKNGASLENATPSDWAHLHWAIPPEGRRFGRAGCRTCRIAGFPPGMAGKPG